MKSVGNLSDIELIYRIKEDFDRQALQPQPSKLKNFLFDVLGVLLPIGAVFGVEKISEQLEDFLRMRLSYVPEALIERLGGLPEILVLLLNSYCSWNQSCAVATVSRSMGIRTDLSLAVWSCFQEYLSTFFDTQDKAGIDRYMRFFYLLTREVSRTNTVLYGNILNLFEQRNWLIKKYLAYAGLLIFDKQKRTKEFLVGVLFDLMSSIVQRLLSSFVRNSFLNVKISERTISVRDSSSEGSKYFIPEQTVCMKGSDVEKCLCNFTLLYKNLDGKGILTFFLNPLLSIVERPLLTTFRHLSFDQKKKFLENGASCYSDIALNSCCIGKILCFFGFFCAKLTVSMVQTFTRFK